MARRDEVLRGGDLEIPRNDDPSVYALVVECAGRTFVAGDNIAAFRLSASGAAPLDRLLAVRGQGGDCVARSDPAPAQPLRRRIRQSEEPAR